MLEKDPDIKNTLGEVLNHLTDIKSQLNTANRPGEPPSATTNPTTPNRPVERPAPLPQPVDVRVHATAEATITDEREKDPKKAAEEAARGDELRKNGNDEAALDAYKKAFALNPLPMYFLIILELETSVVDTTKEDSLLTSLPPSPVTLEEIYEELSSDEPDTTPYSDAPAFWVGQLSTIAPIARDAGRTQYVVTGTTEGQDFVVSVPSGYLKENEIGVGNRAEWQGRLQGFKIVNRGDESKIRPVLVVDRIE